MTKTKLSCLALALVTACGPLDEDGADPFDDKLNASTFEQQGQDGAGLQETDLEEETDVQKAMGMLQIFKQGTGSGSVVGTDDTGRVIDCGADCDQPYLFSIFGTTVTLRATPASNSKFAGWDYPGCGTNTTCVVNVDLNGLDVVARFDANTPPPMWNTVTVENRGTADSLARVVGTRVGDGKRLLDCGMSHTKCSAGGLSGWRLNLQAETTSNARFKQWSGACAGTNPVCTVAMDQDKTAIANFVRLRTLTVTNNQTIGRLTADVKCRSVDLNSRYMTGCSGKLDHGTTTTVSAYWYSNTNIEFTSGPCKGKKGVGSVSCTTTMTADRSMSVRFF